MHEALLTATGEATGRLDVHQVLADLFRRLVHVQSRRLAAAAGVCGAWQAWDGRDVLLPQQLLTAAAQNLTRLEDATSEPQLSVRARRTRRRLLSS